MHGRVGVQPLRSFVPEECEAFKRPAGPEKTTALFLSHRGPDTKEQLVRALHFILDEQKVAHFFDQDAVHGITLGENNADEMARGLFGCRLALVFFSKRFHESRWCVKEVNTILQRQEDERANIILPVFYKAGAC